MSFPVCLIPLVTPKIPEDSMLTLFLSISGGLSWMDALDPLRKVSSIAVVCMIIFIATWQPKKCREA